MTISYFCDKIPFYGDYKGGVSAYSLNLIRSMMRNMKLSVIDSITPKLKTIAENNELATKNWPDLDITLIPSYGGAFSRSISSYLKFRSMASKRKISSIDLINTDIRLFVPLSKYLMKTKRIPILKHVYMDPTQSNFVSSYFQKQIYNRIDGFISTSPLIKSNLIDIGIDEDKIFYCPPQIDCDLYRPPQDNDDKPGDEVCNFLYLGYLIDEKLPIITLLDVCSYLRQEGNNFHLNIHGWGTREEQRIMVSIKKLIDKRELNDFVSISSKLLPLSEKIELFNQANVIFLLYSRFLAVDPPITMLEVMSSGKIFMGSNVQSIPSVIQNGYNGILVDKVDFKTLCDKFTQATEIYDNEHIQKRARADIKKTYSYPVVSSKLLSIYKRYGYSELSQ
jgi:glycosyltransferase involved in cell wall biosynthesis